MSPADDPRTKGALPAKQYAHWRHLGWWFGWLRYQLVHPGFRFCWSCYDWEPRADVEDGRCYACRIPSGYWPLPPTVEPRHDRGAA